MPRLEALVVVDAAVSDDALNELGRKITVKHRLPPRIAVVEVEPSELDAIKKVNGVIAVCDGPVPASVLDVLEPTERLFVEAWSSGRTAKVSRPGDGLPWDAPGFQPPDMPDRDRKKK